MRKIKTAIIGTGNIGTDLMLKILRSEFIELVAFVGRRENSDGIHIARKKHVNTSINGIDYFINNPKCCDVVYDCTDATTAQQNYNIFELQGMKVIDLTPAKIGKLCIPSINSDIIKHCKNINMVTCGGQASIPILNLIASRCENLSYVEVVSQISSDSAGMATRINIDEYIDTTEKAIKQFTGCKMTKVILNLNPAIPQVDMQTSMFLRAGDIDFDGLMEQIEHRITIIKKYIPHYKLMLPPVINDAGILVLSVRVRGAGDYLPPYSGNLDIINCAAIECTNKLVQQ